jgi:RND family efflux transporter MFP subunit
MRNQKHLQFVLLILLAFALAACSGTNAGRSGNSVGEVTSVTVTDTVGTSGNLSADQLTTLTWGTSGLVEKVNVQVGDKVKKGDILAALSTDSVPASILQAQAELATAQNELNDLKNTTVTFTQAQLDVLAARKDVEEAENTYNGLNYPRASDALIKNTEAKITEQEHKVTLATKKYKEYQDHPDGDPLKTGALLDLTNAQMELNQLRATLNWYLAKPSEEDYEEAKLNLEKARANLEEARLKRDRVKNGADPADIAAAEAKVAAAQANVDAMYIIAPFDGEVIAIHSTANNSVNNGDSAVGLVNRNTMKIDTAIDESSISQISLGDTAQITMDSLPDTTLTGKVTLVDPIGKTVSGLVKYTVTVSLDPTDAPVLFGATATVTIVTSEPYTSLAVPIGAVQTDSRGEYVMRIKDDSSTERIEIKSGDLAGKLVTITTTSDLKEGDRVQVGTVNTNGSSGNNDRQQGPGELGPGGGGVPFGGGG